MATDDHKVYPAAGYCGRGSAEPVSSTLAAQLAPRLSSQGPQAHNLSRETFSQLRQELVGGEYNQLRLDDSITDVSKLICIVLKAGLVPSTQNEDPQGQILDCLDIIQTIVEKAPQMLTVHPDFNFLGEKTSAPLYSWLVVRLLHLLCDWGNENISQRVGAIFSTLSFAQYRHTRVLLSHSVLGLLRACTTEILSCLESLDHYELRTHSATELTVPIAGGQLFVDLNSLGLPHAIFDRKLKLGSIPNAINLVVRLLDCLIWDDSKPSPWKSKSVTSFVRHNLAWVLNGYQRLWSFSFRWLQSADLNTFEGQARTCVQILGRIGSLHVCGVFPLLGTQWTYGLLQILDEVSVLERSGHLRILHPEVSRLIIQLAGYIGDSGSLARITKHTISPRVWEFKRVPSLLRSLDPQLQAAIEALTENLTQANSLHGHPDSTLPKSCNADTFELTRPPHGAGASTSNAQPQETSQASKHSLVPLHSKRFNSQDLAQRLIQECLTLLRCENPGSLAELRQITIAHFTQVPEQVQCKLLGLLGNMSCAMAGSLSEITRYGSKEVYICRACDHDAQDRDPKSDWGCSDTDELYKIMACIIPRLTRAPLPRIASMVALRRILAHSPAFLDLRLSSSFFGEFCLHSLRSSIRELRVATGHCIIAVTHKGLERESRRDNFIIVLEWLRSLSEKQEISLHETCILTLCQLAKLSGDEEMNIILLRLLEYLGHPNLFICAIAYTEVCELSQIPFSHDLIFEFMLLAVQGTYSNQLSKLAQQLSLTPAGLFRPFWGTLSVAVVKNFQSRPYMAEQLCSLLGMKVDDFLRLTEAHVLPYMVLTRKRDFIARIGATYQDVKSPFDICSEKGNLAAILAFLLSQPSPDPEHMIMSTLSEIDNAFECRTLAELVRIEPILIACDLLKGLGDSGDDKGARFHRALHLLAALVPRKSAHGPRKMDLIGHFIEEHVLGIITQFAHVINDFQIRQPLVEKKRNIMAIGAMVKVAGGHVGSALPQICACLRSALDIEELCNHAVTVWSVLINSLNEEEVEPLIDQTLSIVIRYWNTFTESTRECAFNLVKFILRNHSKIVGDVYHTMPSLASIPMMSDFETEINSLKGRMDTRSQLLAFIRRCQSENATVVEQALTELVPYLSKYGEFLHRTVLSEQPDPVVAQLTRVLLDCCVKFSMNSDIITLMSARCLGLVGCLDANRVDSIKEKRDILVLSNFENMEETFDFILFFLQHVLVETFLSASNTRAQGFLAYAMQGLLRFCSLDSAVTQRSRDVQAEDKYGRWLRLPETVRNTLTPFLTSKYTVTVGAIGSNCNYPLFSTNMTHGDWLRIFVQDLLQKGSGDNARLIFSVCSRVVKGQDISIASFLLPFAVLNRVVGGTLREQQDLLNELVNVLSHPLPDSNNLVCEAILLCSQSVFEVLDYLSRWLQGKKKQINGIKNHGHPSRSHKDASRGLLLDNYYSQLKSVESLLASMPPEIISKRAVECKSFSRALFHWEQYIRQCKAHPNKNPRVNEEPLYQRLQEIYSQIDEPDGIEGISTHLHGLNIDQQVLEHRKAGRWATAQNWYELQLEEEPSNSDAQWNLLTCLKESGQQDAILTRFEILKTTPSVTKLLSFAVEAAWITGKWDKLHDYLQISSQQGTGEFNIGIGSAFDAFRRGNREEFGEIINNLRLNVAKSLTANSVTSLQSCHDNILKLHALAEIESIADPQVEQNAVRSELCNALDRRLNALGGHVSDKQYLLGLRRAAMALTGNFSDFDIAAAWLASTRLLRKGNFTNQAYQSMLHAARLGDKTATIEHARLLWKDGYHRKAIQTLESAITANEFALDRNCPVDLGSARTALDREKSNDLLTARAHLLLAKWTDRAGQTQSDIIVQRYREAIKLHPRWEKAHYYLGKHYNKILESEKAKPLGKEAQIYLSGEASKLVIDNYLRSLAHGNKYVFQSLPRILTLWLEHASVADQPFDPKRGNNEEFQIHTLNQRKKSLDDMHSQLKKYVNRMPAALLFTILPQVVARICHPNATVYDLLTKIVAKAVNFFPHQGLWTVLAVVKSSSKDRASKGINCLQKITEVNKKLKADSPSDMRGMINQGQKFSEEMLRLCIVRIEDKSPKINLARNLGFNHKVAPCRLVVPFQAMLTPTLPASHDSEYLKGFRAFPRDPTTIETVLGDAQVLNSLQKPRKISIRGSDGKIYNILCKPKDDLRKDQRLMEFNNMINRFLKRDVESSKRRMYIKTYAVTPLNEECGLIEWVDNLRTLRDLVIKLLRERGITPNYSEIRHYLNEACSESSKLSLFKTEILSKFPPVLHEWFVEMFPESVAWFAARLRYTRSCAIMSMVGYVLGLGDRHGENILFEEGTGGVIHVDFNCLFDKGLTFDKPELVPFRLTQNMIDAFGAYGYNGPFRKTCEISLGLLRQNEDALMTVLETFLHDPTADFIGKKRRTHVKVPDSPAGVLENVRNKLRGLLPGESVPLSVDGHVDELITEATDERNLAAMYIGWCAFF